MLKRSRCATDRRRLKVEGTARQRANNHTRTWSVGWGEDVRVYDAATLIPEPRKSEGKKWQATLSRATGPTKDIDSELVLPSPPSFPKQTLNHPKQQYGRHSLSVSVHRRTSTGGCPVLSRVGVSRARGRHAVGSAVSVDHLSGSPEVLVCVLDVMGATTSVRVAEDEQPAAAAGTWQSRQTTLALMLRSTHGHARQQRYA